MESAADKEDLNNISCKMQHFAQKLEKTIKINDKSIKLETLYNYDGATFIVRFF